MCSAYIFCCFETHAEAFTLIRFIAVNNPQPYYADICIGYFSIPAGEKDLFSQTSRWLWGCTLLALRF